MRKFNEEFNAMPISRAEGEELKKLHNEVNQYINHKILIMLSAIATTGTIVGLFLKEDIKSENFYLFNILLLSILAGLYMIFHITEKTICMITSYLIVSKSSNWEQDHRYFKMDNSMGNWFGQNEFIKTMFFILGAIPFLIQLIQIIKEHLFNYTTIIFIILYYLVLLRFGKNNFSSEADSRWSKINGVHLLNFKGHIDGKIRRKHVNGKIIDGSFNGMVTGNKIRGTIGMINGYIKGEIERDGTRENVDGKTVGCITNVVFNGEMINGNIARISNLDIDNGKISGEINAQVDITSSEDD